MMKWAEVKALGGGVAREKTEGGAHLPEILDCGFPERG
jgi:hypothetical protein